MPRKAKRKKRRGRPKGSGGAVSLSSATTGLKSYRAHLARERDTLDERIGAIDTVLQTFGAPQKVARVGRPAGRRAVAKPGPGRRGARKGSLKEYIGKVLSTRSREMAVKDIATGVVKAGYKTRNKTLAKSVGIALADMRNVAKVGRGLYKMK